MVEMIATRDAYGKTLTAIGERDERIVVLDCDLSSSTKTSLFAKKYPNRFFNMGIAELSMMNTAAGLAAEGKIPFASTFAIFATGRAWESVRQSIAYPKLNVKIVATHAGITVGEDGASHQTVEDIALMRVIPGMVVIVPADAVETEKAVEEIVKYNGPVYVRLSRSKSPVLFDKNYSFKIGKGNILKKGKDITIFATGLMVANALDASALLEKEGMKPQVVNISTIKPLDEELVVRCAKETGCVVTVEEHSIIGGLGSAISEVLSEKFPVPICRMGIRDQFGTSGTADVLLGHFHLMPGDIADTALHLFRKDKKPHNP